jgi:mannosyltransferase OCH1-like enzyme
MNEINIDEINTTDINEGTISASNAFTIPKILYTSNNTNIENITSHINDLMIKMRPTRQEYEQTMRNNDIFKGDVIKMMYNMNDDYFFCLWMLCELYKTGGIGMHDNLFDEKKKKKILKENISFGFIIVNNYCGVPCPFIYCVPRCVFILQMIISLLNNNSYLFIKNPVDDLYNTFVNNFFIKNTMNNIINQNSYVSVRELRLRLNIGTHNNKWKTMNLYDILNSNKYCNSNYNFELGLNPYNDKFTFKITENKLFICRLNGTDWGYEHIVYVTNDMNSELNIYFGCEYDKMIISCPLMIGSNEEDKDNKIIRIPNYVMDKDENINVYFNFRLFKTNYSDQFNFEFNDHLKELKITRIDKTCGWNHHHRVLIVNKRDEQHNYILEFGRSNNNIKIIKFYDFVISNDNTIKLKYAKYSDNFNFQLDKCDNGNSNSSKYNLKVNRYNSNRKGWGHNHKIDFVNVYNVKNDIVNNKMVHLLLPITRQKNAQLIPKIIHFTHYKIPPKYVFERWKDLNVGYDLTFSLDIDCKIFLKKYFGNYCVNLFDSIKKGMYKADLWRLFYLYIFGGIYTDVDIVPLISINKLLELDCNFYSCLSIVPNSIFQAVMITPPRNPLILIFIWSFIHNIAYDNRKQAGPTKDMYNCLKTILNVPSIQSNIVYSMDEVFFNMCIGKSDNNVKIIDMRYIPNEFVDKINIEIVEHKYNDRFSFEIENNCVVVKRIDQRSGWSYNHMMRLTIKFAQQVYLFQEKRPKGKSTNDCYVEHDNEKIFMSRDTNYKKKNGGWR